MNEDVPEGMGIVRWWGVSTSFHFHLCTSLTLIILQLNGSRYPTWRSLARDYLAVMASSVSSERAFSSAGITISKRRNRLNGDIVEALQCLKSLLHQDISLAVIPTVADEETHMDNADLQDVNQEGPTSEIVEAEDWTWDEVKQDHSDDNLNDDADDDDIIELSA
jgi:hAT family C-terminal dimerisation region